ncbi:MAG: hypothetical protein U0X20_13500 [Caldilineaceae bacterium]
MLVYGDPKFETPLDSLHRHLSARARQASAHPDDLDRLRALLIACGQVEQGVHDAVEHARQPGESEALARLFHQATAHAAAAFYSLAHKELGLLPPPLVDAPRALGRLLQCLDSIDSLPDLVAAVKLPEGFNLHALYPEQYAVAAGQWLADHDDKRTRGAVVVGIRSIGTTLAAVVASVLRAGGWQVQSFTVRPQGHPYARTVGLEGMRFASAALGLVVDEGPGISGSSMAATAAALVKAGLAPESIAFLPGHANEPGGAGAPEVQRWWQMAPRYVADSTALTFGGLELPQALAAAVGVQRARIDNVSGGVWRQHVYPHPADWPAICNQFERVKYLCTAEDGSRVLFKFYGLAASSPSLTSAAEAAAALLQERAARNLAPPVRGVAYGFVATEWLEGTPLRSEAPPPDMAETLGAYIARAAGPQLTASELADANTRLADMIYVNTREACGEYAADRARQFGPPADAPPAAYGDGHMQPFEWICCANGELRKVDGAGHASDHTLIGRQPVAWDLAGAVVEWQLDPTATERLLQAFWLAGGAAIDAGTLKFYRAAYLAFRAGQCALAAQMHDPYERERLLVAFGAYRQRLAEQLG